MFVNNEYKQVIVIRQDLKMGTGKKIAQACHAAVSAAFEAKKFFRSDFKKWFKQGQKKIALKVNSEEELLEVYNKARDMKLPSVLISDAGLTQLPPGTRTAVGIGPAKASDIDKITGHLKLL